MTPRKISPAPAVTATTPATAPTPSTDATSPSSIFDSPYGSPSVISDSPDDAPSPAQNGATSTSFTVVDLWPLSLWPRFSSCKELS
ncbi:hypothetical protein CsatB_022804 [Cannabis sativa]